MEISDGRTAQKDASEQLWVWGRFAEVGWTHFFRNVGEQTRYLDSITAFNKISKDFPLL